MLVANGKCPYCNSIIYKYNKKDWKYGSPIQTCDKCKERYIDKRYHEIAVDGFAPKKTALKSAISVLCGALIAEAAVVFLILSGIKSSGHTSYKIIALGILDLLIMLWTVADILAILSGFNTAKYRRMRSESLERLSDKNYARELAEAGYNVPAEFL